MKPIDFRHQYDERLLKGTFEAFTEPSMTEPDNSLSIPEIIAKFTRGVPVDITSYPWSSGQSAPEDFDNPEDGTLESALELRQEAPKEPEKPAPKELEEPAPKE